MKQQSHSRNSATHTSAKSSKESLTNPTKWFKNWKSFKDLQWKTETSPWLGATTSLSVPSPRSCSLASAQIWSRLFVRTACQKRPQKMTPRPEKLRSDLWSKWSRLSESRISRQSKDLRSLRRFTKDSMTMRSTGEEMLALGWGLKLWSRSASMFSCLSHVRISRLWMSLEEILLRSMKDSSTFICSNLTRKSTELEKMLAEVFKISSDIQLLTQMLIFLWGQSWCSCSWQSFRTK